MGAYSKGANGTISGKFGSVIGSSWRGIDYLRSLPKKSTKEATQKQLAQRDKFAMAPAYLSPIKDILNIGFRDKGLNKISGYNAAVKQFLSEAVMGDHPDYRVDHAKMVLSKGSLSMIYGLTATLSGQDIELKWKNIDKQFGAYADDQVIVVALNETRMMYLAYDGINRGDLVYTLELGDGFSGDTFHVWAFAITRAGDMVSNSQYLGAITIP